MKRIEEFQFLLRKNNIAAYIIPTADYHQSEYVSDYFKGRSFLSGFTGSAGTIVVTPSDARLWTDGRYFIQAQNQLKDSGIALMKMGMQNVPTILEYLKSILKPDDVLAFDGKVINTASFLTYEKELKCKFELNIDLINEIWQDRPALPNKMIYELIEYYSGESTKSKIERLIKKIKEKKANTHILTSLEDQAWLYNLRGDDVDHTPVFLAYTVIVDEEIHLFVDNKKINSNVNKILQSNGIKLHPYDDVYNFVAGLRHKNILIDKDKVNSVLYNNIKANNQIIFAQNPTILMKAIKNETEIKNTKHAHILDGVAVTKFMKWIKENVATKDLTELDAQNYLEKLRRKEESLISLSFDTICAYKENAAMMHYNAITGNNSRLHPEGMLLVDSGGTYLYGTTDITRTISLGNPSQEEKLYFTTVLKSVIDLADTVFLKGCTGQNLDIKARGPIWKLLIDYKCGTGHGVGHILSVHEAPNGFRWQTVKERNDSAVLEPGMITTDEPGIYLENKLGIRTENELLCKEVTSNEFGTFYGFETITYAPIDLDLIEPSYLSTDERNWLNDYHKMVYDKISPYLDDKENEWLKNYTREI